MPSFNTHCQPNNTHPINIPYQHTLSTHPINTPCQHTLSTSTHPINTPCQHQHTLSTHPVNSTTHTLSYIIHPSPSSSSSSHLHFLLSLPPPLPFHHLISTSFSPSHLIFLLPQVFVVMMIFSPPMLSIISIQISRKKVINTKQPTPF